MDDIYNDTNSAKDKKKEYENSILILLDSEDKACINEIYDQYAMEIWINQKLDNLIDLNIYHFRVQLKLEIYRMHHERRFKRLLKKLRSDGIEPSPTTMINFDQIKFKHSKNKINNNHYYYHNDIQSYDLKKSVSKVCFFEDLNVYYEATVYPTGTK